MARVLHGRSRIGICVPWYVLMIMNCENKSNNVRKVTY